MIIHDGSLPVHLNQSIPAMIAMAVEQMRCSKSTVSYLF